MNCTFIRYENIRLLMLFERVPRGRRVLWSSVKVNFSLRFTKTNINWKAIGLMQKYPPIFKKMFLNDVALLWMRGFHAYDTASVS